MAGIGFRTKAIADKELPVIYNDKKAKASKEKEELDTNKVIEAILKERGREKAIELLEKYLNDPRDYIGITKTIDLFSKELIALKEKYFTSF